MWKDKYIEQMYPISAKQIEMEEAKELKYVNIPSSLFKYRAVSKYSLDNLENDTVYVAPASTFNDPYDCALTFSQFLPDNFKERLMMELLSKHLVSKDAEFTSEMSFDSLLKSSLSLDPELTPEVISSFLETVEAEIEGHHNNAIQTFVDKAQKGILLACFSEVNDSILMWSHYAYNHTGFCIEYDFKQCGPRDALTRVLEPVIYTDKIFDMTAYLGHGLKNRDDYNNLSISYAAITKSKEWSYEKEWRLIFPVGPGAMEPFNRPVPTPKSIYLGTRINDDDKKTIISICERKAIPVYQMKMENNSFKLVAQEIK